MTATRESFLSPLMRRLRTVGAEILVKFSWFWFVSFGGQTSKRHALPFELIISLTSYPPRFLTLVLTLKSLLLQKIRPDKIVLWIAEEDKSKVPDEVLQLEKYGIEIRFCNDIKSYKKLIPSLTAFPGAGFLIVDDDAYYDPGFVACFAENYRAKGKEILCGRAYDITLDDHGLPQPYSKWTLAGVSDEPSSFVFPTGVGGVLYPPNSLHSEVVSDRFMELCPTSDDIWFFWMAALTGYKFRRINRPNSTVTWRSSQRNTLWQENSLGKNDEAIQRLTEEYGFGNSP